MKSTIASLAFFFAKTAYATDCAVDPVVTDPCFKDGANPTCVTAFTDYLAAGGIFKGANTDAIRAAGAPAYADCVNGWSCVGDDCKESCTAPTAACYNDAWGNADCKAAWVAFGGTTGYQIEASNFNLDKWDAIRASGALGATMLDCLEQKQPDKVPTACPHGAARTSAWAVKGVCTDGTPCKVAMNKLPDKDASTFVKSDQAAVDASGCCANTKCRAIGNCYFDPAVITCVAPPTPATSAGVASTAGGAAALIVAALASLA